MVSFIDIIKQQQKQEGQNRAFTEVSQRPKQSVFDIIAQRKRQAQETQKSNNVVGNIKIDNGTFDRIQNTPVKAEQRNLLERAIPSFIASAEVQLPTRAKALESTAKTDLPQNAEDKRRTVAVVDPFRKPTTFISDLSESINSFLGSLFNR